MKAIHTLLRFLLLSAFSQARGSAANANANANGLPTPSRWLLTNTNTSASPFKVASAMGKYYKFAVDSTRLVGFDIGESYAGLLPTSQPGQDDQGNHDNLYFWFFLTMNQDRRKETVIWLNGEPGCISPDGILETNGPVFWPPSGDETIPNGWSWHHLTNVVWVGQPVNDQDVANAFMGFWKHFVNTFGLQSYSAYIAGQGYAGQFGPMIVSSFLDANDSSYFDLKGMLLYDPVITSRWLGNVFMFPMADYWSNSMLLNDSAKTYLQSHFSMYQLSRLSLDPRKKDLGFNKSLDNESNQVYGKRNVNVIDRTQNVLIAHSDQNLDLPFNRPPKLPIDSQSGTSSFTYLRCRNWTMLLLGPLLMVLFGLPAVKEHGRLPCTTLSSMGEQEEKKTKSKTYRHYSPLPSLSSTHPVSSWIFDPIFRLSLSVTLTITTFESALHTAVTAKSLTLVEPIAPKTETDKPSRGRVVRCYLDDDESSHYAAKIFDAMDYPLAERNMGDERLDCTWHADVGYTREAWAYQHIPLKKIRVASCRATTAPSRPVRLLLLELIPGESMEQIIDHAKKTQQEEDASETPSKRHYLFLPPEEERLKIMAHVVEAIVTLNWDADLLHNDIYPRNVMITHNEDRPIVIIDFGLSNVIDFQRDKNNPLPLSPIQYIHVDSFFNLQFADWRPTSWFGPDVDPYLTPGTQWLIERWAGCDKFQLVDESRLKRWKRSEPKMYAYYVAQMEKREECKTKKAETPP
ncbi:Alpha/Beta hydrolase protein [Podospora didyma]|uniref:Alpha/Beta hydrolase protein n=1 Tax=Podospora didyma TaxID=330526 RepID=A0AAE0P3X1_9PEZI|nr:Alpha/Beta hydrolase protein [Podospora didyma]